MATRIQIRIPDWTSIEDASSWDCQSGDAVEFRIKRDSGIQLLATGPAIAAVQRIRAKSSEITLRCEFEFPAGNVHSWAESKWPSLFLTLVGVSLLSSASHVIDSSGVDLALAPFDAMWNKILQTGGLVGDGKNQAIVSREFDSPIPEVVRSSQMNSLPSRADFERLLAKIGQGVGAGTRFFGSLTEAAISSFLFETFRNAIEHAIPEEEGVWGVLIEKVALQSMRDIARRGQIPHFIRPYIERNSRSRNAFWICISVADFGCGIQNSLPPRSDESEWVRLNRAFERGVSRKPQSGSPNRGQGLANILDSAARLRACVFVASAGIAAMIATDETHRSWSQIEIPSGLNGTSVSILWPIAEGSPDQATLNLGL